MKLPLSKELQQTKEQVQSSIQSCFFVTNEGKLDYLTGHYLYYYLKPTHRMANILTIEREFLCLITIYKEQQARTLTAARELINNSEGRLENAICIIVHKDRKGNLKLKKWGREQGISVLPIYIGDENLQKQKTFEELLCFELFSHDPFDVTGPVADDSHFYGRRTEAIDFARKLQTGQIRSCFGIRKIRKTSIIHRIINELQNYNCFTLMCDCSRDEVFSLNASELTLSLSETISHNYLEGKRLCEVSSTNYKNSIAISAKSLEDEIRSVKKPLIIIFDEIDYITPASPTAAHWRENFNPFWRNMRAIYQSCSREGANVSVLISGVSSKWFSEESIEGVENAALAFVPEEYVAPLPRGASNAMIQRIAKFAGLNFSEEAAGIIAAACCDIPFWIRKASSFIHKQIDIASRPYSPSLDEVKGLVAEFVCSDGGALAQVALQHLFRVYPELEPACISHVVANEQTVAPRLTRILEKYGVIKAKRPDRISGDMMKAGLDLHLEIRAHETTTCQKEQVGKKQNFEMSDWAEELALISKRRNLIEIRLREIILNFFRYEALNSSAKDPRERISSVLHKRRAQELRKHDVSVLISRLYWLEILSVIERDWATFSRLLGDKNVFQQHMRIINDRPDAHAKKLDLADVALYNRSLSWLEERISRI